MTVIYRAAANGRLLSWSPGTGWLEVEASQPSAPPPDNVESLMKGRTPEEAESARNALARRAARRGSQTAHPVIQTGSSDRGYLAASRPRPPERVTIIKGGVEAT
jgi:hypothetical protein